MCPSGRKRKKREESVDPIGNEELGSLSSKALGKKRRMALRLKPLLVNKSN